MPVFEITVDFEVYCTVCGTGLCNVSQGHASNTPFVEVGPCEKCEQEAYDRGYHQGTLDGNSD